jgi:HEAT repeat protein
VRPALPALVLLCLPVAACRADRPGRTFEARAEVAVPAPSVDAGHLVRLLATGDFVTRNRAATDLVEMGEPALDALGRAGTLDVTVHGATTVSATRPVIAEILERVVDDRLVAEHLVSPHAVVRVAAAEEAGRRSAWAAVPSLIARLEDPERPVRVTAAAALRRVTNRVDAGVPATAEEGHLAAEEWRSWWSREGRLHEPEPGRPSSG